MARPGELDQPYVAPPRPPAAPSRPFGQPAPPPVTPGRGLDFGALLGSDVALQGQLGAIGARGVAQQAGLTAARRGALIGFGSVPTAAVGQLAGDVDETTRQLAQQATQSGISTLGQLQHQYRLAQQGSAASLAGRGLLRSGAYRQHALENQRTDQLGRAQATQGLLDRLSQLWNGYATDQAQAGQDAYTATEAALARLTAQINAGLIANPSAGSPAAVGPSPAAGATPSARVARAAGGLTAGLRPAVAPRAPTGYAPGGVTYQRPPAPVRRDPWQARY